MKPIILITIGDFNGIGPELALKAAVNPVVKKICTPVLIGPLSVFEESAKHCKINIPLKQTTLLRIEKSGIPLMDVGDGIGADINYGTPTRTSGRSAGIAIERAVEVCLAGKAAAIVTAPLSKEALNLAGYNFPGQTEMIALLSQSQSVVMMLVSDKMRVGLVTIHTAIRDVSANISKEKVIEKISLINNSLKKDFGLKKPRIAVLALNPHAGEKGLFGTEEEEIIRPAVAESEAGGIIAEGPFPADAFFGTHTYKKYDAILAMYHDQGLIPLKLTSFEKGVNFSAGLKVIRTSPDHGTAYDIAGKNKANISSMIEALKTAVQISKNRRNYD
ncbi:MAG: 4-hydroxythreonine-4-phosphate dehydrogenase PdxA [Bacteroidetes bacterium]|nr:4-hydroxythreonine-4-phosphate dehydrogenase PdxA [Bacteroidota bacterium]